MGAQPSFIAPNTAEAGSRWTTLRANTRCAGWAQFLRLIQEKADQYGRSVQKVSRWLPSSKTCNACEYRVEAMPLQVREWVCPACGVLHDRDRNAALNILAAGRAERQNACESNVTPPEGRRMVMKQEAPRLRTSCTGIPGPQPRGHVK
nr:transposase [Kribbella soli]